MKQDFTIRPGALDGMEASLRKKCAREAGVHQRADTCLRLGGAGICYGKAIPRAFAHRSRILHSSANGARLAKPRTWIARC